MKKMIIVVLSSLLFFGCSIVEELLSCEEDELGMTFVNVSASDSIDVKLSIVRIYEGSLELVETEVHQVAKTEEVVIASSTKWSEKYGDLYRDIKYYQGTYMAINTDFCLLIEVGENKFFTYYASYDSGGYCDSCENICLSSQEGDEASKVFIADDKITSDVLQDIVKYKTYDFIVVEEVE